MSVPRLRSEDNKEITPDERVFLASLIKMSKVLAQERRQHSLYQQPMRMFVGVDLAKWSTYDEDTRFNILTPFDAPCKFLQMLDPIHTHMYVEQLNINGFYAYVGNPIFSLFLKSYISQYNYNSSSGEYWGLLPTAFSDRYIQPSSVPITSHSIGVPLTDVNFTNNNILTFDLRTNPYSTLDGVVVPSFPSKFVLDNNGTTLTFTILFYRHSGYVD